MTLNFAQTSEELEVDRLESHLAELQQERDHYLKAAANPRIPLPPRSLSEIRDNTEIVQARLESARAKSTVRAATSATEANVRNVLDTVATDAKEAFAKILAASQTIDEATRTLKSAVSSYNATVKHGYAALTKVGLPSSGAELDGQPITLAEGGIEHGDDEYKPIREEVTQQYLMAVASHDTRFPREPGGWSYHLDAYRAGRYWPWAARANF